MALLAGARLAANRWMGLRNRSLGHVPSSGLGSSDNSNSNDNNKHSYIHHRDKRQEESRLKLKS